MGSSEEIVNQILSDIVDDVLNYDNEVADISMDSLDDDTTVVNANVSLESITSIYSSVSCTSSDHSTQTEDEPTQSDNLLLSTIPTDLLQQIKLQAPWIVTVLSSFEQRLKTVESGVAENKATTEVNKETILKNSVSTSRNGQYLNRNNLLLYRLKDIPFKKRGRAFSQYIANKLNSLFPTLRWRGGRITADDIDTAHPMRNKHIVVVKFKCRDLKNLIYCNKNTLKCNVGISEHLSRSTLALKKEVKRVFPHRKIWTEECKIYVAWGSSKKRITNEAELEKLRSQIEPQQEFQRSSSPSPRNSIDVVPDRINNLVSPNVSQVMPPKGKNNNGQHMKQYQGIFKVVDNWSSQPHNNAHPTQDQHDSSRSYPHMIRNPDWVRGHGSGNHGRGQFIPNSNRGRGSLPARGSVGRRNPGGRGNGGTFRRRGQFNGHGNSGRRDFYGRNTERVQNVPAHYNGAPREHGRNYGVERGGYFNSLYRNTNTNY